MKTLSILVLYDGKSGHLSQSLGLAKSMQNHLSRNKGFQGGVSVEIKVAKAVPRLKPLRGLMRKSCNARRKFIYELIASELYLWQNPSEPPDVIISFGGNVIALNISLAALWKVPNIVIGNTYGIASDLIAGHFSVSNQPGQTGGVRLELPVCWFDIDSALRGGQALLDSLRPGTYWAAVIGGKGSGYQYRKEDWHCLGRALSALSEKHNVHWLVSSSRRTGREAEAILKRYLGSASCAAAIWYGEGGAGSLPAVLGAAERIFCTEDSMSMLCESAAIDKPLVSIRPAGAAPKPVHSQVVTYMEASALLLRRTFDELPAYQPHVHNPEKSYSAHLSQVAIGLQRVDAFEHLFK